MSPKPLFPKQRPVPTTKVKKTLAAPVYVPDSKLVRPFAGILDGEPMPTMDERRRRKDYYQQ